MVHYPTSIAAYQTTMARIVPSDLTRLALSGAHEPEIETLATLRDALPDDYTVFHGVHWTRQYTGRTLYGEIDFVVVNNAGRVLCIEQKNGGLEESEGGLFKDYGDERKSVGDQILRSVDASGRNSPTRSERSLGWTSSTWSTARTMRSNGYPLPGWTASGLWTPRKASSSRASSRQYLPPGTPDGGGWAHQVHAFFRQTFEVVPDVHAHIDAQERTYTRLSHGLLEVLANIEMEPLRLHALATAGNGKTLVARHFFDQCVERGGCPLLLCFNRPLAERLKHLVAVGGMVTTWYQFCDKFLKARGIQLDYEAMWGNPDFWVAAAKQVEEMALAETPSGDWGFDTLIVDEAQDFEGDWFEAVRLFLREDADVLWLEDPNQNVRGVDPPALHGQGFVGYRSMLNYRSPERIARFVNAVLPELPFTCANDLPGLGTGTVFYDDPTEQPRLVGRIVGRLLNERFRPQDIAVLSCRGLERPPLRRSSAWATTP